MTANLTPQYLDAEERYKRASSPEERLSALEEMYALLPKHKGTEKLQAELKKKISAAKIDIHQQKSPKRHDPSSIPREGAGRLVLAGPTNGGKSSLLQALTNAQPEIGDWTFTTRLPEQGMVPWEDIQFQLIDLPAISREYMESWVMNVVRSTGLLLLVFDHSSPGVLEEIEETEALLRENKIYLTPPEEEMLRGGLVLPALLLLNKMDLPGGPANAGVIKEFFGSRYEILPVSARDGQGLEQLKLRFFEMLSLVRVYSKLPGKPPDTGKPFVLKKGSTLEDFCGLVHHDFVEQLKFARVWGSETFDGQRVNRDYTLIDRDVIELHR